MLPSIRIPSLILVGAEDAISTRDEMRKIADAIPNAKFAEIPASGHMTTMEKPEVVNEAFVNFVASIA